MGDGINDAAAMRANANSFDFLLDEAPEGGTRARVLCWSPLVS
jgi:hypothetical protein